MNKIKNLDLLLIVFLLGYISYGQSTPDANVAKIKSYFNSVENEDFSGVILVAKGDKILYEDSKGFADIEHQVKNDIETKFNIASITKMFTAVSILQLYEQGYLKLDIPIGNYLPNYPKKKVRDSVTIHQLLTHTSGLNNFYVKNNDIYSAKEVSDFIPFFSSDSLLFSPGTSYAYSGSGYVVLGLIIEKVSDENYFDYVSRNIFSKANMKNTFRYKIDSIIPNKAYGYTCLFGKLNNLKKNEYYLSNTSPAGFHYSTAKDLFKFTTALTNNKFLKKETTDMMFEPKVKGYNTFLGYGIDVDSERYNETILCHSGGWYGIVCELMYFKDSNYYAVVLSNQDSDIKSGASRLIDYVKKTLSN